MEEKNLLFGKNMLLCGLKNCIYLRIESIIVFNNKKDDINLKR